MKRKQFLKGIEQLAEEGAIQLYKQPDIGTETYIIGVVGVLQLDVLEYRLKTEYGVDIRMTGLNYRHARWIRPKESRRPLPQPDKINMTSTTMPVLDREENPVLLFESEWAIDWVLERNDNLELISIHDR